jgi:hypothetical protein
MGIDERNHLARTARAAAPVALKEIPEKIKHAGNDKQQEQ